MNAKLKIKLNPVPAAAPAPGAAGCPLQHVRTFIGLSPRRCRWDDVRDMIDRREIGWAWDIARRGSRRPEIRIWRESLLACLAGLGGGPEPAGPELTLDDVIARVMPPAAGPVPRAAVVRAAELQRRFLCSRVHLARLVEDGELCLAGTPGPRENPSILHRSAVEFLRRRCLSL